MAYRYRKGLDKLVAYAESEGYKVDLHSKDVSRITFKKHTLNKPSRVYIEDGYNLEMKTYLMLHELGHHELRKDWEHFTNILPTTANAELVNLENKDRRYLRRDSYIVASLEEEYLAWDEGMKLAKRFEIPINIDRWWNYRTKCLKSYISYYASKTK